MSYPPDNPWRSEPVSYPQRPFSVAVWKYTQASGSESGRIFFHSPRAQRPSLNNEPVRGIILRGINSEAENKVWVDEDVSRFKLCEEKENRELHDDAHGLIICDGWARSPSQPEEPPSLRYRCGDRIWVERSLAPQQEMGEEIPVINLDTRQAIKISYKLICFVAKLWKDNSEGIFLAVAVGPRIRTFAPRRSSSQLFFVWPENKPHRVWYVWNLQENRGPRGQVTPGVFGDYRALTEPNEQQQIFASQWRRAQLMYGYTDLMDSTQIGILGMMDQDEENPRNSGDESRTGSVTSSNPSSEGLETRWEAGPVTRENCCNLAPNCELMFQPGVDLVPSYIGGIQEVEHYHVQDDDLDECPEGAEHEGHCVLRSNRTQCVFSRDNIRHTCCRLRANPPLPGVGDELDMSLLPWETTAVRPPGGFADISRNVRVRGELERRDPVPAALRRQEQERRDRQERRGVAETFRRLRYRRAEASRTAHRRRHIEQQGQVAMQHRPRQPRRVSDSASQHGSTVSGQSRGQPEDKDEVEDARRGNRRRSSAAMASIRTLEATLATLSAEPSQTESSSSTRPRGSYDHEGLEAIAAQFEQQLPTRAP